MTNQELESQLHQLVQDERRLTNEILALINLADQRKIYLERGYGSLFEWLTKAFHYSESAAQRRIQAARLLRAVPEVATKISTGEVNLTTIAKAQSAIRLQERVSGEKLSIATKAQVVEQITNKSGLETEKTLLSIFPETAIHAKREVQTFVSHDVTRVSLNLSAETLKNLERIKDLLSHKIPDGSLTSVIDCVSKDFLKRKDPLLQTDKRNPVVQSYKKAAAPSSVQKKPFTEPRIAQSSPSAGLPIVLPTSIAPAAGRPIQANHKNTAAAKQCVNPKAIAAPTRRAILQATQARCAFKDSKTGRICNSSYQIEIDHIWPRALGGNNDRGNLRCLCRKHNQLMAQKILGDSTAGRWQNSKS